tara:strand:+ start:1778 stop:2194 length:417 start_codon:yes stop_codon:yes gene_type:complete
LNISSNAVYKIEERNYKKEHPTTRNYYWTNLATEYAMWLLDNFIIMRTRFFNLFIITFDNVAEAIFTSKLITILVKYISKPEFYKYNGVLKKGKKSKSYFENHKLFKPDFKRSNIIKIKKIVIFPSAITIVSQKNLII